MQLYKLTDEFIQVKNQLEELELDAETLSDTLDSLQLPIEEKVENIVKYLKSLEALADAKKLEAKRLSDSASSDLKKVEFFKNYLADNLNKAGIKQLQAGIFELKFRKGSEVVQVDESKIPEFTEAPHLYIEQEPKFLGKAELKKSIKSGDIPVINEKGETVIPGVTLTRNPDSLVVK